MHRFFVPKEQLPNIIGTDAHQIKNVLRMQINDEIELLDGTGTKYSAKIKEIKKDMIICEILDQTENSFVSKINITIAQCLPKNKKMELIIQKCTELGASNIIPVASERSISKADKLERWQKIAKEAAEQSNRSTIPTIHSLTTFKNILSLSSNYDLALIPWELEDKVTLRSCLRNKIPRSIIILIGPEGGFTKQEVETAKQAGFISISLGKNILRTETASLAILSMINYEFEL